MSNLPAVKLTKEIVSKYICPDASEQEIFMFLKLCESQNLNPFIREVYLIKYSKTQPAAMVTGKDTFLKRARANEHYKGFKAGVVVANDKGQASKRDGGIMYPGEKLLGGWAEVYRDDRQEAIIAEASFEEYVAKKPVYENTVIVRWEPNKMWTEKPATMIRKVALVQAHREAFDELEGLYAPEEFPHMDVQALPEYTMEKPAAGYIEQPTKKAPPKEEKKQTENSKESVKELLHKEVSDFATTDKGFAEDIYKNTLKTVSLYTEKGEEHFITDIFAADVSDYWAQTSLEKLRKKLSGKER